MKPKFNHEGWVMTFCTDWNGDPRSIVFPLTARWRRGDVIRDWNKKPYRKKKYHLSRKRKCRRTKVVKFYIEGGRG